MPFRRSVPVALAALAALVLAACTDGDDVPPEPDDAAADELADDLDELGEDGELDLDELLGGDNGLPDPNEQIQDGVFRGEGIILPIPDGFDVDPGALLQGIVAALNEEGTQQVLGQAVNTADFPEPLDIDEIAAENEAQFGAPSIDEDAEVTGATRARQLRFDAIPSQQEGAPDLTAQVILAEAGDEQLAFFQYVAPSDEFDEDDAAAFLGGVGFDPDSSPPSPEGVPAP